MSRQVYFHTNVPAPYRKHQFELLAKRFPGAVFYLTCKQASYRPWSDGTADWECDVRLVTQLQLVKDLLLQRWGSVHLCGAGVPPLYWRLLRLSGLLRHSIVIDWDDGYTSEQIEAYKFEIKKYSAFRRLCHWLTYRARRGVFTPGGHGALMARVKGYRDDQIINAYFSHDVNKFAEYRFEKEMVERSRIRADLGIEDSKVVILNISRFLDWKRLEDLTCALRNLELKHPVDASRCELVLIGDGKCLDHLPRMKELAYIKTHEIKPMNPDDVLAYYCASDIFVFPSEGDIWGLVVNEALSMGLPVICTDSIGASEIVRDGENGYIVPKRTPDALVEKICLLLDDNRRKRFSDDALAIKNEWNTAMGVNALGRFIDGL